MPRASQYALTWSHEHQHYELHIHGQREQCFRRGDEPAWQSWLAEHSAFAFQGQAGRLSVLKEARARGAGYWYAYRTQDRHTRKRYLGPTANVTFARLEEEAKALTSETAPASFVPVRTSHENSIRQAGTGQKGFWVNASRQDEQRMLLLSPKLSHPRLSTSLIERGRLLKELDAVHSHRLALISASAGSGKTTLLSAWVAGASKLQPNGNSPGGLEYAVAWLSLDEMDNDPIRFWASVIAALRTCLPKIGQETLAMLHSPQSPPLSAILTSLLNGVLEEECEIILILDDYHVIEDRAIHESMVFLLDHLPSNLHLVLATRVDPELPLSRWRVRGQMIEIRDHDLRFTRAETTSFLTQEMKLALSEEDVITLQQRTEGWIAGLQLAALSLRKQQDLSGWISDFAGSYRYLLDYVQQDILARLSISLQHFLLQTSIVTRMNAALCQAITEEPTLQVSREMLEEVERANLFVVPLDEQRQWYRYHDLFREALRARLYASQPELVPLLHIRAARWYETQGEWREAITHALAAPDYPLTASLMEQAAPHFWFSGEARTLHTWVLALPDSILCAHTHLALNAALRFLNSVHISTETMHASTAAQVQQTITRMEEILRSQQSLSLSEAEVALIRRRVRLLRALIEVRGILGRGDKERLRLLTQEIEASPPDDEVSWKLIPLSFTFWLALSLQQSSALLVERLRSAKQWIKDAGDPAVTFRVMTWLATAYLEAGQLHLAHQECLSALTLLDQIGGGTPVAGYLLFALFNVFYAWNRLEEASEVMHRLLRIAQDWQQVELLVIGERSIARLALARGDLRTAQEALQRAEALFEQEEFVNNVRWVVDTRIRIWLAQGNLIEASKWAAQSTLSPESWDPLRKWEVLLLVRVALAQQQYTQAIETLERFNWQVDQPADIEKTLEWMALYVVALHHAGKSVQAELVLVRLLGLTESEGYIRVYLDAGEPMRQALQALLEAAGKGGSDATKMDGNSQNAVSISKSYVSRLLAAFEQEERKYAHRDSRLFARKPEPRAAEVQRHGVEPLSRQELRVLRLLVAGQTYTEMAETLIVSPNTIKTQVSSIYRKLGVSRRAEAIELTQRLHLL